MANITGPVIVDLTSAQQTELAASYVAAQTAQVAASTAWKAHRANCAAILAAQTPPVVIKPTQRATLTADGTKLVIQ
jgi:hypothetical protein